MKEFLGKCLGLGAIALVLILSQAARTAAQEPAKDAKPADSKPGVQAA